MSEDLGKLRDAIDLIDREVLVALARRMQLSDKVIAAKDGMADSGQGARHSWCALVALS